MGARNVNKAIEDSTNGAIDLMAKLAVLIVVALLFACYGIREGRTQPVETAAQAAAQQAKSERVALLRRGVKQDRVGVAAPVQRQVPVVIERF